MSGWIDPSAEGLSPVRPYLPFANQSCSMLGDLQRRKASHYFNLIDEDNNGLIQAEDFEVRAQRLAAAQGVTESPAREALERQVMYWWDHLCVVADFDDDEQVSREEWESYWTAIQVDVETGGEETKTRFLQSLEEAALGTYAAMKTTDAEGITKDEYEAWLAAWDVQDPGRAFETLDRTGKGVLTQDDVVQAVKEFYLSNDPEAPGNDLYGELPA